MLKFYNKFSIYSSIAGGAYYIANLSLEQNSIEEKKKEFHKLSDEMMEKLIDVLSNANIKKSEKFRHDFMITKNSLHFERNGHFMAYEKLIALPFYFEFKEDKDNDYELINKLKEQIYPNLKNLDLLKFKDLFKITSKELEYAVLYEIYRGNYDYVIYDAMAISFFGLIGSVIVEKIGGHFDFVFQIILATIISLVLLYTLYYTERESYLDYFAVKKIIESNDLKLLESGLSYLNKRIQLDQLLGKDVKLLKRQFEKIKLASESLKERDLKGEEPDEQIKEAYKKNAIIAENLKNKKVKALI